MISRVMKMVWLTYALTTLVCVGAQTKIALNMNGTNELEGKWACVSAVVDGQQLPKETVGLLRLTLTRDRYKTEKGSDVLFDSTYTVDTAKTPRQINMIGTEGNLKGKEAQGIYLLEGGTLRICYTMPGDRRPEKFESPSGSKAYLVVWKRE